ncbi:hypothetical protein [Myroides sp. DW712]|uniref:hypothetical protein n=1 Tax=Myroides sp. DW712 TaxID=3389800 RepID=UPI0039790DF7
MNKEVINLIPTVESLINIGKSVGPTLTALLGLIFFEKKRRKSSDLMKKDEVPLALLGKKYISKFKKPQAREKDFYLETGIKARAADIMKFIELKRTLNYIDWWVLKKAQGRIRFEDEEVKVKWNVLDLLVLVVLVCIVILLFCSVLWFIFTVVPLLIPVEIWVKSNMKSIVFLFFSFLVMTFYLLYFLNFLQEPLAVFIVKRDIEKIRKQNKEAK